MPDLPATIAGVVITIGIAALLAAVSGAAVKIAGNEVGATSARARVATGILGLVLVSWSAWSLREHPFSVSGIEGTRLEILDTDGNDCAREIELGVFVHFRRGPGTIRYEVRLPGSPTKTFNHKITQSGSGSDLLGPETIRIPPGIKPVAQVVVVAPNLKTRYGVGEGADYLTARFGACTRRLGSTRP